MVTQTVSQVPPLNRRTRTSMRAIHALVKLIAQKFHPDQIILFGSYAYGTPTAWSDVDLLEVIDTPLGELETALEILSELPKLDFCVDIIARSRAVLEKRKTLGDWFLIDVTEKGKLLYERADQRMG